MDEIIHEDNSCVLYMAFMRSFQEHTADDECRVERRGQQQHFANRTALETPGAGQFERAESHERVGHRM